MSQKLIRRCSVCKRFFGFDERTAVGLWIWDISGATEYQECYNQHDGRCKDDS